MTGEEFARLRKDVMNKTQDELATMMAVTPRTIKRIEKADLVDGPHALAIGALAGTMTPPPKVPDHKSHPHWFTRRHFRSTGVFYQKNANHPDYAREQAEHDAREREIIANFGADRPEFEREAIRGGFGFCDLLARWIEHEDPRLRNIKQEDFNTYMADYRMTYHRPWPYRTTPVIREL